MPALRSTPLFLLLLLTAVTWGQEIVYGPDRGQTIPPLKVFDATGPHQGKEVNYTAEQKGKPTVYVFIQADKWDRPMARFLKKLDEVAQKEGGETSVVAVWLTHTPEKTKTYLPFAQQSLQFQKIALTCFSGDKTGPKGWNVNTDAHLTAVVAHQKVVDVFGYRSVNETNVPEVRHALKRASKRQ